MKRKLVKQGPASLTVSLPAAWLRNNNLSAGDEVDILLEQNHLTVTATSQDEQEIYTNIDARNISNSYLKVLLSGLHKRGFGEIRLSVRSDQMDTIDERIMRHLMGYEVVQHKNDSVTIRAVMKADIEELATLVRRAFLVTIALAEGAETNNRQKEVILLESTNNRLTNYCERILVQNVCRQEGAIFIYIVVWILEKIADEYRDIILAGKFNQKEASRCVEIIKKFYELYYKFSFEKHDALNSDITQLVDEFTRNKSPFLPVIILLRNTSGSLIALNASVEPRVD